LVTSDLGLSVVVNSVKSTDLLPLMKRAPCTRGLVFGAKWTFLGDAYSGLKVFSEILLLAIMLNIDVGGRDWEALGWWWPLGARLLAAVFTNRATLTM